MSALAMRMGVTPESMGRAAGPLVTMATPGRPVTCA